MTAARIIPLNLTETQVAKFHANYTPGDPDTCWNWEGRTEEGYGRMWVGAPNLKRKGTNYRVHRIAFWLHYRYWPTRFVLHKCDNPTCVNPHHLYEGTQIQNVIDRDSRGRTAVGIRHGKSKFTPEQVRRIRAELEDGGSVNEIARREGVASCTISFIRSRATWRWLI